MADEAHPATTDAWSSVASGPLPRSSYQQLPTQESTVPSGGCIAARRTSFNFVVMSILFSANHGCVVACLALATARLGSTGAWQSGILYLTYTLSAVLGATWVTKKLGSRNAIWLGMGLYCAYVGCFWIATRTEDLAQQQSVAYAGAAIGGIGAGFLWISQGTYFAQAAEEHAMHLEQPVSLSTSFFAGIFAFFYLSEEVFLRLLSTILVGIISWESIFGLYTLVTLTSTLLMPFVFRYPSTDDDETATPGIFNKVTVAGQLLWKDPKMKWMIGLNAVFGFASAFLNSYVNGQVVPVALNDPDSHYVGALSAWGSGVAAGMSLVFGRWAPTIGVGKGSILILGAVCFFGVAFPFLIEPKAEKYGWCSLVLVYTLHGIGRATFEGTLKATFADYFSYEKEGAFANIILQNGFSGAIGYVLSFSLHCDKASRYCIKYRNGDLHDVLTFELLVVLSALLAIVGYNRSSALFRVEQQQVQGAMGDATYRNESDDVNHVDDYAGDDDDYSGGVLTATTTATNGFT